MSKVSATCTRAPQGWVCTRLNGHFGPCAAEQSPPQPDHSAQHDEEIAAMNASPWSPSAERSGAFVKGWMARAAKAQPLDTVQRDAQSVGRRVCHCCVNLARDAHCEVCDTHADAVEVAELKKALREEMADAFKYQQLLATAAAFVRSLRDGAGSQPTIATGYLSDILDKLSASAKPEASSHG